jgi:argininosuccinate synthase
VADVGQEEDFKAAEAKALKVGAKKFVLKVGKTWPCLFFRNKTFYACQAG